MLVPKTATGWRCNNHLETYEFVNGKDYPIYELKKKVPNHQPTNYCRLVCNSLFAIWGVDPLGLDPLPFKSQKNQKTRSPCLTLVSPRGSNEAKETAGMNRFSLSKQCDFFGRSR